MTGLRLQKRLAASVLGVGQRAVWLDPMEANEISMANSREYSRGRRVARDEAEARRRASGGERLLLQQQALSLAPTCSLSLRPSFLFVGALPWAPGRGASRVGVLFGGQDACLSHRADGQSEGSGGQEGRAAVGREGERGPSLVFCAPSLLARPPSLSPVALPGRSRAVLWGAPALMSRRASSWPRPRRRQAVPGRRTPLSPKASLSLFPFPPPTSTSTHPLPPPFQHQTLNAHETKRKRKQAKTSRS